MRRYSYRLDVKKQDEAGFLSHGDLTRIVERVLTGSGLPIHTSGGHKWPSPKISVLHPLPVGVESMHEMITFHLRRFFYPSEVRKRMGCFSFPGLERIDLVVLSDRTSFQIEEMTFVISFSRDLPDHLASSDDPIQQLMNGKNRSRETVPEQVHDFKIQERRTCFYRTTAEKGFLNPRKVVDWLRSHTTCELPPVQQLLKKDMILKR